MGYGYDDWVASGMPGTPYNGKTRVMDPKDTIGFAATADCAYHFSPRWSADLYARYINAVFDNHYTILINGSVIDDKGVTRIPMSNIVLGVGVKYAF